MCHAEDDRLTEGFDHRLCPLCSKKVNRTCTWQGSQSLRVHFGAFWEQGSRFWGPSQGLSTFECPFFGLLWVHFFCPITRGVIGQKKWFPLGSILEHSGCQLVMFRCVSVISLCEGAGKEPQLVHSSPRLAGCQVLIDKPRSLHMCFCRVDLFWDKHKSLK